MWVELHDREGRSIFVNMQHANDFGRANPDDQYTKISLDSFGENEEIVYVTETPEEVMALMTLATG